MGMGILGMLYTCEAIGFLRLNNNPPRCSEKKTAADVIGEWVLTDWVLTDWAHTYRRPKHLWTYAAFGGPVKGRVATASSDPLGYDLAEAIRAFRGFPK